MTTPKVALAARAPAYRIQLPINMNVLAAMMAGFGPPLFKVQTTTLFWISHHRVLWIHSM